MLDESKLQKGELKGIATILLSMQEEKEYGKGVSAVRELARLLKKSKVKEALQFAKHIGKDVTSYPEIRRFIHDVIYPIGYLDPETGEWVLE